MLSYNSTFVATINAYVCVCMSICFHLAKAPFSSWHIQQLKANSSDNNTMKITIEETSIKLNLSEGQYQLKFYSLCDCELHLIATKLEADRNVSLECHQHSMMNQRFP